MNSWRTTTLGEIVDVLDSRRRPVNSDDRYKRLGDVPYYGANGQQGWIDVPLFDEPLILLAEDGGNFDDFTERPIAYRITGPSWVNNHAHIIRATRGNDQSFVFWTLVHRDIRRFISGGTRTKLTQAEMRSIELTIPVPPEQQRIADILDTLDDQIQATQQIITKLTLTKHGLLEDLLNTAIRQDVMSAVGAEFEIRSGITLGPHRKPKKGSSGYLRVANVQRSAIRLDDISRLQASVDEVREYKLLSGDLLVVEGHADVGQIGRCARVLEDAEGLLYQNHLFRLRSSSMDPVFAECWLNSEYAKSYWRATCSTSSGLNTINSRQLRSMSIAVPTPSEQRRIGTIALSAQAAIDGESRVLDKLKLLKRGLMSDLLTGRVRVPLEATA